MSVFQPCPVFYFIYMPRKKRQQKIVKYYMPKDAKEKIDEIVDRSPSYKNKPVWKQKFYYLADYIAEQNSNLELDGEEKFINIHQETMAKILGVDNRQVTPSVGRRDKDGNCTLPTIVSALEGVGELKDDGTTAGMV